MPSQLILRIKLALAIVLAGVSLSTLANPAADQTSQDISSQAEQVIEQLEEPLYNPFVERYVLDELKQLRSEQAQTKHELIQQIVDREHQSVDRAVAYATDTVTYFFYLIAAATSVLVIVGWSSIREIKDRVHTLADEEISKLINEYEKRLAAIEAQLQQKTQHIEENREEIERTQEVQSLWLRAQQESSSANKILIYDELLKLRPNDCEALTYKADAVLELDEPQWAANLCHQALKIDEENSHAFYQLACAYTAMGQFDEAIKYLLEAISRSESYREELKQDPALASLLKQPAFVDSLKTS
ncbi:TPR end-of-group domain-containing protein [Motilimonas sp. KMU-193]|uniref:TPR end-of-group domain-containing protein n=1 Tax=Motilimonas sp. KMU-193 TaxID=3388668 RepID=UPI00396B2F46